VFCTRKKSQPDVTQPPDPDLLLRSLNTWYILLDTVCITIMCQLVFLQKCTLTPNAC